MTLVPLPGPAKPRPDLPPYEIVFQCAHPDCGYAGSDDHHLWRRQNRQSGYAFWVEVEGKLYPARTRICSLHHREVTDNEVWIRWVEEDEAFHWLSKDAQGQWTTEGTLEPHPPLEPVYALTAFARNTFTDANGRVSPGQVCPACERRVPHPRKTDSPRSLHVSFRVPTDVKHDYKELVDAAAVHAGVAEKPFREFSVVNAGLALVLQAPRNFLSEDA